MKKLIFSELLLLFLATTFVTDSPPPGWYQQTIPTNKPITDIFFIDSLRGWATISSGQVYDSGKVITTTDGGNSWATQYAKDTLILNAIQFLNLNTGYCVGGYQKILRSINGGQNWIEVGSPGAEYFTDLCFVNVNTGWVCDPYGFGGIFKTTNGGSNWQPQMSSSYYPKKLFFINKDTGWTISNEAAGKLYWTTNSGVNWNLKYTFTTGVGDVFFVSRDTGIITGGGSNGMLKTTNAGNTWFPVTNPPPLGLGKIFMLNNKKGWIGCGVNKVLFTLGNDTWYYQYSPSYNTYSIDFIDSLVGWGGGTLLVHTLDGGGPPLNIKQNNTEIPSDFKLYQNYPNPFNPKTNIKFSIKSNGKSEKSKIKLAVYDISGREIAVLLEQELNAGEYLISFDGANYSSGIYFYSLVAEGKLIDTKRMILLK
jgi:photosystem II stability/assembly factor-like uncharacterized protein